MICFNFNNDYLCSISEIKKLIGYVNHLKKKASNIDFEDI
jgi:hypothetical protein